MPALTVAATTEAGGTGLVRIEPGCNTAIITKLEGRLMLALGKHPGATGQRVMRAVLIGQVLPTLLLTPSQAGAVLLHSHCDESHHVHVLQGIDFAAWIHDHESEHHGDVVQSEPCCEASEPPHDPDGVVLQRPPMLVCRVRSADTAALQPNFDTNLPHVVNACISAPMEPAGPPPDTGPPRRGLDALVSGSHALLI